MSEDACSPARWNPPTSPTPSPRSPASSSAKATTASTAPATALDYRSVMPTNLYGPGDNYHPENSHVIPALIRRFHEAKAQRRAQRHHLGHRHAAARISACGRHGRRQRVCDEPAQGHLRPAHQPHAKPHQRRLRQRHHHRRAGPDRRHASWATPGQIDFDPTKPDGTPRKLMDSTPPERPGLAAQVSLEARPGAGLPGFSADNAYSRRHRREAAIPCIPT